MLTKLRIRNFKAWQDTEDIRLAPLTLIFGANSIGKSSLGHLLIALQQTINSSDRSQVFQFGDNASPTDLGTYKDCVFRHDERLDISFSIEIGLPKTWIVRDHVNSMRRFSGNALSLAVTMGYDSNSRQPSVRELRYSFMDGSETNVEVRYKRNEADKESHEWKGTAGIDLLKTQGRPWPADRPEKFYRMSDQSRARFQNAGFVQDFAYLFEDEFSRFNYLGPLRDSPRRTYQWSGDKPGIVGFKGENTIAALLSAEQQNKRLNESKGKRYVKFMDFIGNQLRHMHLLDDFSITRISQEHKDYEVQVKAHVDGSIVKIPDIGFGVSQSLPPVVQAFYCQPNSTIWMEQPEIHLHPQAQAELADVFIRAINSSENGVPRNVQLIVESHSEHFLQRLQRRVAEGMICDKRIAIYFCKRVGSRAVLEELNVDSYGNISNWPKNFFGDEWAELKGRLDAEMKRRM